jgi:hypothetical protein
MRKVAFAFAAAALMLLAGALSAEATTGAGTFGLRAAAKDFSPVETAGCRTARRALSAGSDGHGYAGRSRGCWCARCWR